MDNYELEQEGFPLTWDNTMRVMGKVCPRKLYWFLRRYDYANRPAYFTWGSAWHEILRTWYSFVDKPEPDSPEWWVLASESIKAGEAIWDAEAHPDQGNNKRASLENIFTRYLDTYPVEPWKLVEGGAEAGWQWPLPDSPWLLGGAIDLYIDWPGYGTLPLEIKTSGSYLGDSFITQWAFSPQITGYIWYVSQLRGEEIFGCLVNMATKQIPGPNAKWTTPPFSRSLETRSNFQLSEFISDYRRDIEEIEDLRWKRWHWPKTTDTINCSGGTGKAACLFKSLCLTDGDYLDHDPLTFQGIVLREEKWEPWKREGESQ